MCLATAASHLLHSQSSEAFDAVIDAASGVDVHESEIAFLATVLASSGEIVDQATNGIVADIASTGGIGSLSTILGPLMLVSLGATVMKIGVPGRPAGAVDVLAQVQGYDINPDMSASADIIAQNRFFHSAASHDFAPLDGALFAYRKKKDAVAVVPLIIASLLSKKVAAGINACGFDIRYGVAANFARTHAEAKASIPLFEKAGRLLGIRTYFSITDSDQLPQPYIGRGEVLLALDDIFKEQSNEWVSKHVDDCKSLAAGVVNRRDSISEVDGGALKAAFMKHLSAQGGSSDGFDHAVDRVRSQPITSISANRDGRFAPNISEIRNILTEAQANAVSVDCPFPDPSGVVFHVPPGHKVLCGQTIASIRNPDDPVFPKLHKALNVLT